jgi:MFS family permease
MNTGTGAYRWFAAGVGTWFGAWGLQSVLFSWLVVLDLRASAVWVGIAQTTLMLPTLLLLLVGGAAADRVDPRHLLVRLQAAAAAPGLVLAAGVFLERLSLPVLLAYAVSVGTIAAFAMPARDALLSRVAGPDMMRAVTGMTAVQFGCQALGALAGGAAQWVGTGPMLLVQGSLLLAGSLATQRLPPAAPAARAAPRTTALREIGEGLACVAREPRLRGPALLAVAVGIFFIGPFLVTFPLVIREVYADGGSKLGVILALFPAGTLAGSLALRARGGVRRKGLAMLVALAAGCLTLGSVGLGLPFPGMALATFVWGLAAAVFINCGRTLYQEAAPEGQRARVLSVYQLGFMGAMPLGALGAGFLGARVGPLETLLLFAGGMLLVTLAAASLSDLARME